MAPGTLKVFGSPASSEGARVMTCLFEKEVEFDLIRVDAYHGTKRTPQYPKLRPHGEALTFEDGNVTLVESRSILRHIADKYKNQGTDLIGMDALERFSVELWLQTEVQSFDGPSADMIYSLAYLPLDIPLDDNDAGHAAEAKQQAGRAAMYPAHMQKVEEMRALFEKSRNELGKLLDIYEQRLQDNDYLAGDKFTLADLSHLPNADKLASDPRSSPLLESRPNVSRWWDKISRRDTWAYVKRLRPQSADALF